MNATLVVFALLAMAFSASATVVRLSADDDTHTHVTLTGHRGWRWTPEARCKKWHGRDTHLCYPGNRENGTCFRLVVDKLLTKEVAQDILLASEKAEAANLFYSIEQYVICLIFRIESTLLGCWQVFILDKNS
eukprot:m.99592 g.99592  ORF g.99592 m.99592 type:complete len:133 (-) comp14911_c2_seq1:156-554(-)